MAVTFLIAGFIDNDESAFHVALPFMGGDRSGKAFEASDMFIGGCIIDTVSGSIAHTPRGNCKMRFPNPRWPKEQYIFSMSVK